MAVGKSKSQDASHAEQLIAGTKLHFASAASVAFAGGQFTPAQVETSLQTLVDLRSAVDAARATMTAKVAAELAQAPALRRFMSTYDAFVRVTFGEQPDVLADFGLKPRKATTPLTVEQKADAKARRQGQTPGHARGAAHDGSEAKEGRERDGHHARLEHALHGERARRGEPRSRSGGGGG